MTVQRIVPGGFNRADLNLSQIPFRGGAFAQLGQGTKPFHLYPCVFANPTIDTAEGYRFPVKNIPAGNDAARSLGLDLSGFGLQLMTFGFRYTNDSENDDASSGLLIDFLWYLDPAFSILVMEQANAIVTGPAAVSSTIANMTQWSPVMPYLQMRVNNSEVDTRRLQLCAYFSE